MKLLAAFVFLVSFAAAAQAQGGTVAPPEAPAQPSGNKPAQPSEAKPAQPSEAKPAQPSEAKPAQPGVITERVDSTPKILQSPETPFFRPFHITATGQMETPEKTRKLITIDKRSGNRRLYTVPELKKIHSAEIKALRQSLKKRPNSEIRKAVEAREAGQKTELQSLQEAILTEAEKDQTGSPQPKPENQIIQIKKTE